MHSGRSTGGTRDERPLVVQILSISCSFGENLEKLYVGDHPPPRIRTGAPLPPAGRRITSNIDVYLVISVTSRHSCFRSGTARCWLYSGHIVPLSWPVTVSHWRTFRVQPHHAKAKKCQSRLRTKTIVCTNTIRSGVPQLTYYRPQAKLRKGNVFTSMCQEFCPHGGRCTPPGQTPPGQTLALGRHSPWADTPQADTLRRTPPSRRPRQRTVPILQECILVSTCNVNWKMAPIFAVNMLLVVFI